LKILFSLIAILLLLSSSVPLGLAESLPVIEISSQYVLDNSLTNDLSSDSSYTPKVPRTISVSLEESVGIASGQPPKNIPKDIRNAIIQKQLSNLDVSFSEKTRYCNNTL